MSEYILLLKLGKGWTDDMKWRDL